MRPLVLLVLLLSLPFMAATSVGVSPARITKDNLLPGSHLQETIILSRSSAEEIAIEARITGAAKDWVIHQPKIIFPQGVQNLPLQVEIKVPTDAELGTYAATINYFMGGGANVDIAVSIPVSLTITDQEDSRYQIKHIKLHQEDTKTLVSFEVYNKGNIASGPTVAKIDIFDATREVMMYQGKEKVEKVQPFEITTRNATFTTGVLPGYYWVDVQLEDQDQKYSEMVFLEAESNGKQHSPDSVSRKGSSMEDKIRLIMLIPLVVVFIFLRHKHAEKRDSNDRGD